MITKFIRKAIEVVPEVKPLLSGRAATLAPTEYKTYEYFLATIEAMVRNVYNGFLGNEFVPIFGNLIGGQLLKAYEQAWEDSGMTTWPIPTFLQNSLDNLLMTQGGYIEPYYQAILEAGVDKTGIEPLLARAQLWAGQYNTAYQNATIAIGVEFGQKMIWREGDTIRKCKICLAFDGIVAYAKEWDMLGIRPRNPPNHALTSLSGDKDSGCQGWRCECTLEPTDQRRSPNAYGRLEEILLTR